MRPRLASIAAAASLAAALAACNRETGVLSVVNDTLIPATPPGHVEIVNATGDVVDVELVRAPATKGNESLPSNLHYRFLLDDGARWSSRAATPFPMTSDSITASPLRELYRGHVFRVRLVSDNAWRTFMAPAGEAALRLERGPDGRAVALPIDADGEPIPGERIDAVPGGVFVQSPGTSRPGAAEGMR